MNYQGQKRTAVVAGGTSGLGFAIAAELIRQRYRVAIIGRDEARLHNASERLMDNVPPNPKDSDPVRLQDWVMPIRGDVAVQEDLEQMVSTLESEFGALDVLINAVGQSDRGSVANLTSVAIEQAIRANVLTALLCSQAMLPMLERSGGVIINIGSLAGKVGPRHLGSYPAAKHALTGLTQQMRLEWKPKGVHVGLVSPGPIQRDDAGKRYQEQVGNAELPESAARPGGGTIVKGLDPQYAARVVLKMIQRRNPDVMLPGHLRPLVAIGHLWPQMGDWLLSWFTRSR